MVLQAIRDAKDQVNRAAQTAGHQVGYADITAPFHGVKVVFSGDYLQRMVAPAGVSKVTNDGVPHPFDPPATGSDVMWAMADLKRGGTRVLVLVVHDNHRLLGLMHAMHATGFATASKESVQCRCVALCALRDQPRRAVQADGLHRGRLHGCFGGAGWQSIPADMVCSVHSPEGIPG